MKANLEIGRHNKIYTQSVTSSAMNVGHNMQSVALSKRAERSIPPGSDARAAGKNNNAFIIRGSVRDEQWTGSVI